MEFGIETGVAVICGFIVEGLKQAGMPSKYAFLASMLIGAVLGGVGHTYLGDSTVVYGVYYGVFAGAVASGFYSGTKSLTKA